MWENHAPDFIPLQQELSDAFLLCEKNDDIFLNVTQIKLKGYHCESGMSLFN